jgi:arylsulfatase A-like enzyme
LPTIPARRAIHTGIRTFPFDHDKPKLRSDDFVESPGWHPIPPSQTHIAEYMNRMGFVTSFITSTYHQFKPNMNFHLGFHEWHFIRGQEHDKYIARMIGKRSEVNQLIRKFVVNKTKKNQAQVANQKLVLKKYLANIQERKKEEDYFPAQTFVNATQSVERLKSYKNCFFLIDEFDPHEPWDPPERYLNLYLDNSYLGNKIIHPVYSETVDYLTEEELKCMRACYAGEVTMCDNWFGYFLNKLKEFELYEDSLILLLSDHGISLGEHNAIGKIPLFMHPELVDIPFMIKPPGGINGPKRIEKSYVYHQDILPTIFGFLGKEKSSVFEGMDLSLFVDEEDHLVKSRDYVTCGMGLWTLFKDDNFALITSNDKSQQKLFDLRKDPKWNDNIAEENPDVCEKNYKKIEKDAKGNLLLTFKTSRFDNIQDWYQNTYLT